MLSADYDVLCGICHPLFKVTPLNYFDYVRYYDDGRVVAFSTSVDFSIYTLSEFLLPTLNELQFFSNLGHKVSFLSTTSPLPIGLDDKNSEKYLKNIEYASDHKVYHRMYITDRKDNYFTTSGFGVKKDSKSILNFHINSVNFLQRFIRYFEVKSSEIFSRSLKNFNIILPKYHEELDLSEIGIVLPSTKVESYNFLDSCNSEQNITPKEQECLGLIAQGYTMKLAALKMQISHRTVEQHLRNIKDKFGLHTKNQLVDLWHTLINENY